MKTHSMRRMLAGMSLAAFAALAMPAYADDTVTTTTKEKVKVTDTKVKRSKETKTTENPGGLMNGTTDKTKVDSETKLNNDGTTTTTKVKKSVHDAPGMKNDSKETVKTTTTRDADGNVIDTKVEQK